MSCFWQGAITGGGVVLLAVCAGVAVYLAVLAWKINNRH